MSSKLSKPQLLEQLTQKEKELETRSAELKQSETKVAQLRATLETFSQKISQTNSVIEEHQSLVLRHAETEKQLLRERAARIKLQKAVHASKGPGSASSPVAETASCANLSTAAAGSDNNVREAENLSKKLLEERAKREAAEKLLEEHKSRLSLAPSSTQEPNAAKEEITRLNDALAASESELKGLKAASKDLHLAHGALQEEKKRLLQDLGRVEESKRQALRRVTELEAALKEVGVRGSNPLVSVPSQEDPILRELRRKLGESEAGRRKAEKEAAVARLAADSLKEELRHHMQAPRQDSCPPSSFSLPSAAQQATAGVWGAASRDKNQSQDHFSRFECQLKEQKELMAKMQSEIKWLRRKVEPAVEEPDQRGTNSSDQSLEVTRSGGESPHPNGENRSEEEGGDGDDFYVGFSSKRSRKRGRDDIDEDRDDIDEGPRREESQEMNKEVSAPGSSSSPKRGRLIKKESIPDILLPITHGHARRAAVILGGGQDKSQPNSSGFSAASVPTLITIRTAARQLVESQKCGNCTWEEVSRALVSALLGCARDERDLDDLPLPSSPWECDGGGGKRGEGGDLSLTWMGWCSSEAKRRGVLKCLVSCILIVDDLVSHSMEEKDRPLRPLLPLILRDIAQKLHKSEVEGGLTCGGKCALLSAAGLVCRESGCLIEFRAFALDLLGQDPPFWSHGQIYLKRDQYMMLSSLLSQWPGCISCGEDDLIGGAMHFIISRTTFSQPKPQGPGDHDFNKFAEVHIESLRSVIQWLQGCESSLAGAAAEFALDQASKIAQLLSTERRVLPSEVEIMSDIISI